MLSNDLVLRGYTVAQESGGLGEQALSKVAEMGLESQLDESDNLDVNVKTDPLKVIQGQVDSVSIKGEGLVMKKDLRVEEMEMKTGSIAINPLSAAFGKIELTEPTQASARVVLTEEDLNRASNSEYIHGKLQNMTVEVEGRTVTIDVQQVNLHLLADGKITLNADILQRGTGDVQKVAFTATPRVSPDKQHVSLDDIQYAEGQSLPPELNTALLNKAHELLNLSKFSLQGMSLKIQTMEITEGSLTLQTEALITEFPSA
ncbi:DUF2993 domain-containing protein [Leptolyngbya sp. FACHB-261]|uniref:LmeA family phospholipid-binding protein n=1 Tax=Leptolyngbya sp. FACHB-261 TaxID=2692806 RepID=UPI001685B578|nr:DUF2993 domain-containing protein [Leptolyngbya sp. FACHB-261]MBD2102911.1 DUF2993 domain-containing protein [Leptolyngbya sp. FACHB-261]